jgi:tetratricopeptide (TPR) repeat protein
VAQAPRQNPNFKPGTGFSTEDYYVWSRCDGKASFKDIILMVGLPLDKCTEILGSLKRRGAILMPGEDPQNVQIFEIDPKKLSAAGHRQRLGRSATESEKEAKTARYLFDHLSYSLDSFSPEESDAMRYHPVDLSEEQKKKIIAARRAFKGANYYDMLGVPPEASMKEVKRAYFRMSKELHPDRFYRKELGPFQEWVSYLFEASTKAFNVLTSPKERRIYDGQLRGTHGAAGGSQSPEDHARELFSRACDEEIQGDLAGALRTFAAVIRLDVQAHYVRRAATCALRAQELSVAEEYAKKAVGLRPDDPSYLRVLADVLRAAKRLSEAETTLSQALSLHSDNDKLMGEIMSDLNEVRRQMGIGVVSSRRSPHEGETGI